MCPKMRLRDSFAPRTHGPLCPTRCLRSSTLGESSSGNPKTPPASWGTWLASGALVVNPHLLIQPFVTREAVLSSKIEGSQATLSDVLLSEATPGTSTSDVREVSNYVAALDHALERARTRPVGLNLILEIHEILMS